MSRREKIMAALVGVTVLVAFGFFAISRLQDAFKFRQSQIDAARRGVRQKKLVKLEGQIADEKLAKYRQRSLPGDLQRARSQYQGWLIAATVDHFGESRVEVKPAGEGKRDELYYRLAFTITGQGNLDQLTRFLYHFYEVDYLHRIKGLRIQPLRDSRSLKLSCTVEALALLSAPEDKTLGDEKGGRLAQPSLDAYTNMILSRNLFGPPNKPPTLSPVSTQSATVDRSFFLRLRASEPDTLDRLSFELEDGPSGMQVDQARRSDNPKPGEPWEARLSWTPQATGTYQVRVSVADDGLPPRRIEHTFTVEVRDPPPPPMITRREDPPTPPRFDIEKYTYLTSVQAIDGKPIIWLYERPTGRKHVRSEGDVVEVGEFKAKIRSISIDQLTVHLEVGGETLILDIGKNLRELRKMSAGALGSTE